MIFGALKIYRILYIYREGRKLWVKVKDTDDIIEISLDKVGSLPKSPRKTLFFSLVF